MEISEPYGCKKDDGNRMRCGDGCKGPQGGNPWIFDAMNSFLTGEIKGKPDIDAVKVIRRHSQMLTAEKR